ncbi:hypothetical protein ACWDFL_32305 [Streptomyces bungoensis]
MVGKTHSSTVTVTRAGGRSRPSRADRGTTGRQDSGREAQREPVGKRITARITVLDHPDGAVASRRSL